jgi:hypothetical protein
LPGWYAKFCDDAVRQPDLLGPDDRDEAVRDAVFWSCGVCVSSIKTTGRRKKGEG